MEAFSARMLVCSAMSLMSSTMLPISCEDSPSRLRRLLGSWMAPRMVFMPPLVGPVDRLTRDVRGALGVARDGLGGVRHVSRGLRGTGDLLGLRARCLRQ